MSHSKEDKDECTCCSDISRKRVKLVITKTPSREKSKTSLTLIKKTKSTINKVSVSKESMKMGITLTLGEVAENHVGMQQIGSKANRGLSYEDLTIYQELFEERGLITELYNLNDFLPEEYHGQLGVTAADEPGAVLVVRNGLSFFLVLMQIICI